VSVVSILAGICLVIGAAAVLLSTAGVARARGPQNQIHFLGPASTIGVAAFAAAIVIKNALNTRGIKALIVLAVIGGINPVLMHVTARAALHHEQHRDRS
jgi:multisubunit Na+/H+ antiporter MnhG subunit